jgi:hypothetical protein
MNRAPTSSEVLATETECISPNTPTRHDLPACTRIELDEKREDRAVVVEWFAKGVTAAGFVMYACCTNCGASVAGWRRHRHHQLASASNVILEYSNACSVCGGSVLEVHAEAIRDGLRA